MKARRDNQKMAMDWMAMTAAAGDAGREGHCASRIGRMKVRS